jgi:FkbM family methyltransferase
MNYIIVKNFHDKKDSKFYTYDLGKCIISDTLRSNNIWESHIHNIFCKYIDKESIVIEGGCHIGSHTLKLAYLCKKLYAFEPMPESYDLLFKNIQINNIDNTTIFKKGLSNKIGNTKYQWICENNPGGAGLENNLYGDLPAVRNKINKTIPVDLITIDSLNLEKLDFIKLDIEGYEKFAIEGGMNTIIKCKPIITLEVFKSHSGDSDIEYTKKLFKNLVDIGYIVYQISGPDYLFLPTIK